MTLETIRALDGPALTGLAVTLGLAPEGTELWPNSDEPYDCSARACWTPHISISQADAVFRALRARDGDWHTLNLARKDASFVSAGQWRGSLSSATRDRWIDVAYGGAGQDTECVALLRVACLAVASEREGD